MGRPKGGRKPRKLSTALIQDDTDSSSEEIEQERLQEAGSELQTSHTSHNRGKGVVEPSSAGPESNLNRACISQSGTHSMHLDRIPRLKDRTSSSPIEAIWRYILTFIKSTPSCPGFNARHGCSSKSNRSHRIDVARTVLGRWLEHVVWLVKACAMVSLERGRARRCAIITALTITRIDTRVVDRCYYMYSGRTSETKKKVMDRYLAFRQQYGTLISKSLAIKPSPAHRKSVVRVYSDNRKDMGDIKKGQKTSSSAHTANRIE
ncbi:hypothetical protein BASA50_000422 [Batrachochytrium salamandrivorans]|uniref:Uncharacterized protein n=1 Tax=Batrachochytrium salamandrivorans TaxID=1357716 RepID=A0ABQ8ETQ4_9FUNG|nr:hypothetical protein BASA60_008571 [Batrachochytrium salamandrivorans]KAH6576082.1 hypothetical protein BASA62_001628 [Batrachochytrium salamandrivorans]KAH6581992.1 hypothetical protein BASA61_008739 [Batrachochytrium salamandrivorans]KAH6586467.1 hypothetical protein BASA50_000422 [Batrachochytrium salamandrivorans]KAH9275466.1 hypothetical protein BASA83_002240 [Batrachochytrium salamandrivorans]